MVTGFLLCVAGSPAHSVAANMPCSGSQPLSHGFPRSGLCSACFHSRSPLILLRSALTLTFGFCHLSVFSQSVR